MMKTTCRATLQRGLGHLRALVNFRAAPAVIPAETAAEQAPGEVFFLKLPAVLADPRTRNALRERLSQRTDAQHLEFLIGFCNFNDSGNALQRFEQFRNLIDQFVRDHAERPVLLSPGCRRQLLREWSEQARVRRIPADLRIPSLDTAAAEIQHLIGIRELFSSR